MPAGNEQKSYKRVHKYPGMGTLKKVGAAVGILLLIIGVVVLAFYMGVLGVPTGGLEDPGDWGNVTEDRTEVITTFWVENPNPIGITVGDSVGVDYSLALNGVNVANGEKNGINIRPGRNTVQLSTYIQNNNLAPWWVAFIQNNETIDLSVDATANIESGIATPSIDIPDQERTLLNNSTPIVNALSQAAAVTEEESPYTVAGYGYEVRRGWASWGQVNQESTTVLFHFEIHNPNEVRVPTPVPEGVGISADMNGVKLLNAQGDEFSVRDIGPDTIPPGETREVVIEVQMDNSKVDDWFRSHVRRGENTEIETRMQLVFDVQGSTLRIPQDAGPAYTCNLQTGIFVDNQSTTTNCAEPPSVPDLDNGDTDSSSDEGDTGTTTDSPRDTVTPAPTPANQAPVAQIDETPPSGQAPLEVSFDASGSYDPDGEIRSYNWNIEDSFGTTTKEGETIVHNFQDPGEYTIELLVTDRGGKTSSETVTIDVTQSGNAESPPNADAKASPTSGQAPLEVDFSARDSSDPNDDISSYSWRFDDGRTAQGEAVTHTFDQPRTYQVELAVTDSEGNIDRDYISIEVSEQEQSPTAVANANPTSGQAPLSVEFDASDSSDPNKDIESYRWFFDDGSSTRGELVTHTFDEAGTYDVELVVTDSNGNTDRETVSIDVSESEQPPTADADATPTTGEAPLEVQFDASGSSDPNDDIVRYVWRFKDGSSPAEGETVTHTFQTAGEYDVELIVYDSEGNQDRSTVTITVERRVG